MIKVSIVSIGDEILIGQTINTNSAFIGEKLTELGFDVIRNYVVGDNKNDIMKVLEEAEGSSDIIFVTGGLGPTHDDITRTCILEYFNTELVFDEGAFSNIQQLFKKRGREVTEVNRDQAFVPKSAVVIENKRGTAPGYELSKGGKLFFILPGVPYEMKGMMESTILLKLESFIKEKKIFYKQKVLLTTGIPESGLYELLGDIPSLIGDCKLAFLPSQYGVKLRISAKGINESEVENRISGVEEKIKSLAQKYIYSDEEKPLEAVVGELLRKMKLTIAVAESCTGGMITNRLTNVSGSSKYFNRGVIAYSNESKMQILGVSPQTIEKFGSVSKEVAVEMARGIKKISSTNIGLSTTGIMGPTGATPTKLIGLIFIGYADDRTEFGMKFQFGDDRLLNKERSSQAALELVRRMILKINNET